MKKYELTEETNTQNNGCILHRIRAVRDFGTVKAGDLGGWVESENNLSHDGLCWIFDNAIVKAKAKVRGNASVGENVKVCGSAKVSGKAIIIGDAIIYGTAKINRNIISGSAIIGG